MSMPQWKGLFDWSIKYQDGTAPSSWDPSDYNPDKMRWLEGVLKHYMQDFTARMKDIRDALAAGLHAASDSPPAASPGSQSAGQPAADAAQAGARARVMSLQELEELLEELMDIVSSIDLARDLHKIGGLPTLLELLDCQYPSLRWRAAEVVATCMANNPPVQQWFLEGGVLPALLRLVHTPHPADESAAEGAATLRTKGLLALSALVRHCPAAQTALLGHQQGVPLLAGLATDADQRVQRKALSLLQYCCSLSPAIAAQAVASGVSDAAVAAVCALLPASVVGPRGPSPAGGPHGPSPAGGPHGAEPQAAAGIASLGDGTASDVRVAALSLLQELASSCEASQQAVGKSLAVHAGLLPRLTAALQSAPPEDADMYADEVQACDQLAAALRSRPPAAPPTATQASHAALPEPQVAGGVGHAANGSSVEGNGGMANGEVSHGGPAGPQEAEGSTAPAGSQAAAATAAPLLLGPP